LILSFFCLTGVEEDEDDEDESPRPDFFLVIAVNWRFLPAAEPTGGRTVEA
jgi:hypothetical protein